MITITIPSDPDHGGHRRSSRWIQELTAVRDVCEKAGTDLRSFEGQRSADCSIAVAELIKKILDDPRPYIAAVGYYAMRAVVPHLTDLFFTLRERPDGIVRVTG